MTKKSKTLLGYKLIGWQGIELQVPEDWNFVVESGESRQGSVGFASGSLRFEIKWEKVKKRKKFSLESITDKFIKKLQKAIKNFKLLKKENTRAYNHNAMYFHFKSETDGYGMAWHCDKSEKNFIGLFLFKPVEYRKSKRTLKCLLDSFRCHNLNDWKRWALYGFSFKLPSGFELKTRELLTGHVTLRLLTQKSHPFRVERTEVIFQYWSPANVNFEETYNDQEKWVEQYYERELSKMLRGKIRKEKFRNLTIEGHVAKALRSTIKGGLLSPYFAENQTCSWYCPTTNRIYALTLSMGITKSRFIPTRKNMMYPTEMFNKVLASVSCHQAY